MYDFFMPEGEITLPTIESRRVRIEEPELRFELHQEMFDCFPEQNLFEEMEKALENVKNEDFVGLREETVRFGLLKVIRSTNLEIRGAGKNSGTNVVHKGEIVRAIFEIDSNIRSIDTSVNVSDIDSDLFMEISEYCSPSEEIMKAKGWDADRTRKFVSRLASNVFKSGLVETPNERIPLDIMVSFFVSIQSQTEMLVVDQKKVAMEYLLDGLSVEFYKSKLPKVVNDSGQTEEDISKISKVKDSPRYEQILNTLQTVRENTEFVRRELIPACLEREDDAQTVFWKIHAGEFKGDPMAAQMLLGGSIAEVFNYVKSISGEQFYNANIGTSRKLVAGTRYIEHIVNYQLFNLTSILKT